MAERVHNGRMKARGPVVSPEDQALFLAAVDGARPLETRDRVPVPPAQPSIVKVQTLPAEVKLVVEGDGHRYTARAPGVSHAQVAELRAGRVRTDETLDLHGDTVDAGLARLRELLVRVNRGGRRCILVIHGKGTHSEHGAPLREAVLAELLGPLSGVVHALSTAAAGDGGEGATYVVLRSPR
jgi:DNA-nicking Smr family endonuclease